MQRLEFSIPRVEPEKPRWAILIDMGDQQLRFDCVLLHEAVET